MAVQKIQSAQLVADFFLTQAKEKKKLISNKKLQKLLYYAQAWHLVFHGKKLFKEDIEAWIHGPAIKEIYVKYKKFGFAPIDLTKYSKTDFKKLSSEQIELLENIWKIYGKYDADYLEELTHSEEPWQKAREGLTPTKSSDNVISDESMKTFYKSLLKESVAK